MDLPHDTLQVLPIDIDKLNKRIRAFTGTFVVMISPVLLGIVLKKVNLAGAGKYQGIRVLEVFVDFVQGWFPHIAATTLQIGILPFLCVVITEPCADYITSRLLAASKVLVFLSNISLMILGCGILLLIHKKAWLVLSLCSIMVIIVIFEHITIWFQYRGCVSIEGTKADADKYHSKLEHLLDLSTGTTVMMFLVLECVVLEGLLRNNSQGQAGLLPNKPLAPAPSEYPTAKGQETFLGGTLLISFVFSMIGVFLMNVWTTPHVRTSDNVVLTTKFMRGLSSIVQALPIAVAVILITMDVLPHACKPAVWLPVFPPFIVLLFLLARTQGQAIAGEGPATGSASSVSDKAKQPKMPEKEPDLEVAEEGQGTEESEDQKPVPLELTKVAFTGFLAVAVPSVTNASVGIPSIFFVLCTATAVLLGLLWRLLTHEARPSEAVLKAANHASFFAHTFISLAGVAFWVMAVNASK